MKKAIVVLASTLMLFSCNKQQTKPTPGNTPAPSSPSATAQRSEDGILYYDESGAEINGNDLDLANNDSLIILAEVINTDEAYVFYSEQTARQFLNGMQNQTIAQSIIKSMDHAAACRQFAEETGAEAYVDQHDELPQDYLDMVAKYEDDNNYPLGKTAGIGSLYDNCTTTGSNIWLTRYPVLFGWRDRISSMNFICTAVGFFRKNFYRGSSIWIGPWNATSLWTHSFCLKYTNWNKSARSIQWY